MNFDTTALANILRAAAKSEILPRFRRLGSEQVRIKTDAVDLVTEADEAAERAIAEAVIELAPGALFVGEEAVAANPELVHAITDAEMAIVVDPIDGTANYAAGMPLFGVMASVVHRGETVAGIIYDPMGDDWFIAEKGAGAFLVRPDGEQIKLKVADTLPLAEKVGHASLGFVPQEKKAEIFGNLAKVRIVANYRTAAHDYRAFASGNAQFLTFHKLMPWDHLAGSLIAQEAGGYVRKLDGSIYKPGDLAGGLLLATDEESWTELRRDVFTF
jgi:fructose-1,6-bisphosphatase/inositol monophosphatase family enzyme